MKTIAIQYYKCPAGELILGVFEEQLCLCDWRYRRLRETIDRRICDGLNAKYVETSHPIADLCISQLEAYFAKELKLFDVPILEVGTVFQKSVWEQLRAIPWGETQSYQWLADRLQNPKAVRAVASANGANAISIITPCHRIVGSDGSLVGYAGGLPAKKKLLDIEAAIQPVLDLGM